MIRMRWMLVEVDESSAVSGVSRGFVNLVVNVCLVGLLKTFETFEMDLVIIYSGLSLCKHVLYFLCFYKVIPSKYAKLQPFLSVGR